MGISSSNQLSLFKMKQIYICDIYKDKIEFLQGDSRTLTSTFYFDEDIKFECFEILSKLNKINSDLDYVNLYYHNNIIYAINDSNIDNLSNKTTVPTSAGCFYSSNKIIENSMGFILKD